MELMEIRMASGEERCLGDAPGSSMIRVCALEALLGTSSTKGGPILLQHPMYTLISDDP